MKSKSWSRRHLTNTAAFDRFIAADDDDRARLPELLADLAEVDARKMYLPRGYSSMRDFCVRVRHWSHDVARKRIRVARKGRQFPEIFDALSDGRVHLTAVSMLAPHLRRENVSELIAAATHKTMDEVAALVATRFPSEPVSTVFRPIGVERGAARPLTSTSAVEQQPQPGTSEAPALDLLMTESGGTARPLASTVDPGRDTQEQGVSEPAPAVIYELRCTLPNHASELIRRAEDLRGGSVGPAGIPELLVAALEHYVAHLEKQKFAATEKPRQAPARPSQNARRIPAEVRRAVRERDGDRCTFVSECGQRCESRAVQFDHVVEVARGGKSTVQNVRLLCHAHNQYAAEQTFGAGFMEKKRRASVEARAARMRARYAERAAEATAIVERKVVTAEQVPRPAA